VIEIENISVTYKSGELRIPALSSVNLKIEKGEYLSILGPNGSGKSTLVKALCGLVTLDNGSIKINGAEISAGQFSNRLFGKVGVVFQEPSGQFLMPSVKREIESVLENLGLEYALQQERFNDIISEFELQKLLNVAPQNLSPGQMQIINLAVAFITGSDLLILDEPTTFLDLKYRKLFLDYICGINDSGRTIIHVTQYTDEALHSGSACVMDSGSIAARGEPYRVLSDDILLKRSRLSVPVGIEFKTRFGFDFVDSEKSNGFISGLNGIKTETDIDPAENKTVISVENLSFSYPETGFSLSVDRLNLYENQIAGLVGPSGSGKSTLALLLAGILNPLMGAIEYNDKEKYRNGFKKFVGLSWQMPDPVLIGPTVREDLQLAFINPGQGDRILESLLEKTGLAGFDDRIVDTLSGGEKRKLSLASVLAAEPDYLILDEPAAFLDPVSQKELRELIREISRSVKGALIIGQRGSDYRARPDFSFGAGRPGNRYKRGRRRIRPARRGILFESPVQQGNRP
jgi:energy-coupling factor transport system ATP-binding protein